MPSALRGYPRSWLIGATFAAAMSGFSTAPTWAAGGTATSSFMRWRCPTDSLLALVTLGVLATPIGAQAPADRWSQFRGGPQLTGRKAGRSGPSQHCAGRLPPTIRGSCRPAATCSSIAWLPK